MDEQRLEGNYGKVVTLDICYECSGIWFDSHESPQLTPGSILHLFTIIHEKRAAHRNPLVGPMNCPYCRARLVNTSDLQRSTRFHYVGCPQEHGRFITFFQFFREKNFVRSLHAKEINQLKAHVKMTNCSNCGAAVDLEKDSVCTYCRTPISMLDPKQIETTLQELQQAEKKRQTIDPLLPMQLLLDRQKVETLYNRLSGRNLAFLDFHTGFGLVEAGLSTVVEAIKDLL